MRLSRAELERRCERLNSELGEAKIEIRLLRGRLDALARRIFGTKSEKLDPGQLQLLLALAEEESKKEQPSAGNPGPAAEGSRPGAKSRKPRRPRVPDNLPCEETVIEPEVVRADPSGWRRIGEERSEQLDYRPGRFVRLVTIRPKYVRLDQPYAPPVIAPLPPRLQERCGAAPGLLAHVVVGKYCDHLPLYRQEFIYRQRHGVRLPRQRLDCWVSMVAWQLGPLYRLLKEQIFSGDYIQIDETPVRRLAPGHGRTRLGYLWATGPPKDAVLYQWRTGRSGKDLEDVMPPDWRGTLQCDAYEVYKGYARKRAGAGVVLAGCMAHARRRFFEARDQAPLRVGWLLHQIGLLYRIERELRDQKAGPALRDAVRASQSRPILRRIRKALDILRRDERALPASGLGKAVAYSLDNWEHLNRFALDGAIEIDNNLIENSIRPTAIGKKNYLFFGPDQAGQTSAVLYSLLETAKRCGIDPYAWILDVLNRLPTTTTRTLPDLLPATWKKAQTSAVLAA